MVYGENQQSGDNDIIISLVRIAFLGEGSRRAHMQLTAILTAKYWGDTPAGRAPVGNGLAVMMLLFVGKIFVPLSFWVSANLTTSGDEQPWNIEERTKYKNNYNRFFTVTESQETAQHASSDWAACLLTRDYSIVCILQIKTISEFFNEYGVQWL